MACRSKAVAKTTAGSTSRPASAARTPKPSNSGIWTSRKSASTGVRASGQRRHDLDRLGSAGRLRDDLDVVDLAEQFGEQRPRGRLVVDDHDAEETGHHAAPDARLGDGNRKRDGESGRPVGLDVERGTGSEQQVQALGRVGEPDAARRVATRPDAGVLDAD